MHVSRLGWKRKSFLPRVSQVPDPAGFQFVPTLDDTACQTRIARAPPRAATQPWLASDAYTSPSILHVEQTLGLATGLASDPFQIALFSNLSRDTSISTQVIYVLISEAELSSQACVA